MTVMIPQCICPLVRGRIVVNKSKKDFNTLHLELPEWKTTLPQKLQENVLEAVALRNICFHPIFMTLPKNGADYNLLCYVIHSFFIS